MNEEDEVEKRKKELEEEEKTKKEQEKLDKEQLDAAKKEHPDDKIARATAAADRLEAANKIGAQQIEELRTLQVNAALGGESEAGSIPPEKKEQTPEEYAKAVMAGEVPDGKA